MPDNPALPSANTFLRGANAEILVVTAIFFRARIEHDVIVDQFEQTILAADMDEFAIEGTGGKAGSYLWLLPL